MTRASYSKRTEGAIIVRSILTGLKPFSTGQAAYNWARKVNADNFTVLVKNRRRPATAMTVRKVGNYYEGRT